MQIDEEAWLRRSRPAASTPSSPCCCRCDSDPLPPSLPDTATPDPPRPAGAGLSRWWTAATPAPAGPPPELLFVLFFSPPLPIGDAASAECAPCGFLAGMGANFVGPGDRRSPLVLPPLCVEFDRSEAPENSDIALLTCRVKLLVTHAHRMQSARYQSTDRVLITWGSGVFFRILDSYGFFISNMISIALLARALSGTH